jgi:DNA-binding CsgD family transcriptional regulator
MLLADAVAQAQQARPPMRVLRTSGIESESPLAFAALQRLLRPAMRHADKLPAPQTRALRAAFGEAEGAGDRFLVFLGALSLLAETAEEAPVLAVVDDAHWLDDASAAALQFVARRLGAERVALLFAVRDGDVRRFDSEDLPVLVLDGLDAAGARDLLTEHAGVPVPADVADRLARQTGGNPLALVEIADALSGAQLRGEAVLPAQLPVTEGVERAFLDRYRRLREPSQTWLLVAAADDSGHAGTIAAGAAALGADERAQHEVERSGLVQVRGGMVEMRHPLVRSAVYSAATSLERRRAHRALAEALTGAEDGDRRAWHLAAAVDQPDAGVVAELDDAAERARARGGHEAAAAAWERAAELTTDAGARARRLYLAARAGWLAAQPGRAKALVEAALADADEPGLRADAARLRARIEWNTGSLDAGHGMVLRAAADVAPHDLNRAREMAMFATALASVGAESATGIDPVTLVPRAAVSDSPRVRAFDGLLVGLDLVRRQEWRQGMAALRATFAVAELRDEDDQDLLPNLGIAAMHVGADELGLRYHDQLLARARGTGAVVMILYSLTRRAVAELATGRWTSMRAGASEALPLAEGSGQPGLVVFPLTELTLLAALRGDDAYDELIQQTEQVLARHAVGIVTNLVPDFLHWARGIRSAAQPGQGSAPTAFHHLEQIRHPVVRHLAAVDRFDVAVRAGQRGVAERWVSELAEFADATGVAWAAAAVEHGRAVLADNPQRGERHFKQALTHHEESLRVPDRARTQLAYGELLRRTRRRVDARDQLRGALITFEELGAAPFAERAAAELRASGETARRRDPSTATDLTAQELQVARLVRQGMSNRDAAAQLFLSPRTIDFHLRNVFSKLGVTSRAELAAMAIPDSDAVPSGSA